MEDLLLAKGTHQEGTIDCSIGEPHIVRNILMEVFSLSPYDLPKHDHMYEYPSPNGFKPLVQLLEDKYHAPVIITNGAKQALGACFFALHQMGKTSYNMRTPYWALIPPLGSIHGMEFSKDKWESYLLLAPNNPDGFTGSPSALKEFAQSLKDDGVSLIHDAAYYSRTYLPETYLFQSFGDVQIYSISKMFGLSGLRLGYVVCHNPEFYSHILRYMEMMTVGASIISQIFLFDLMRRMHAYPTLLQRFEGLSSMALEENKKIAKQISEEILIFQDTPGMFGWAETTAKTNFEAAKIKIVPGHLFGDPSKVRINLALPKNLIEEMVKRLNG